MSDPMTEQIIDLMIDLMAELERIEMAARKARMNLERASTELSQNT